MAIFILFCAEMLWTLFVNGVHGSYGDINDW